MSGELEKRGDPLLRELLDSARVDEPPQGAEDALLAALGLGAAGATAAIVSAKTATHGASTLGTSASSLAKAVPVAAKLLGVLGVVGLGAVAWHQQQAPTSPMPRGSEPPSRSRTSSPPGPVPTDPVAPQLEAEAKTIPAPASPPAPARAVALAAASAGAHPAPQVVAAPSEPAPPGQSLETETHLLAAARAALSRGDQSSARDYLRRYEREVQGGTLQREADMLWERAR